MTNKSLNNMLKSLYAVIQGCDRLIPGVIPACLILFIFFVYIVAYSSCFMMLFLVLSVLTMSITIFISTKNYGESSLAFAAGLLTVFSVNWTLGLFVSFMLALITFSLMALVIASISLASKVESIYIQASIFVDSFGDSIQIEKRLREIGDSTGSGQVDVIERAEIVRTLCFYKIDIDIMRDMLILIERLYVVTSVDVNVVTYFYINVAKLCDGLGAVNDFENLIHENIKSVSVPPVIFINTFSQYSNLAKHVQLDLLSFFDVIVDGLNGCCSDNEIIKLIHDKVK